LKKMVGCGVGLIMLEDEKLGMSKGGSVREAQPSRSYLYA